MSPPPSDETATLEELHRTPEIFARLAELSGSELQIQKQLRAEFPPHLVPTAMLLQELRKKGQEKFSRSAEMWFDRQGLEQSTSELVANHKAKRFDQPTWDLCSGMGGDAIALAKHVDVTAIDQNPAACLRTEWNARVYGVQDRTHVVCADVESRIQSAMEIPQRVHVDPDRRAGKPGRSLRIEDGQPGLPFLRELMEMVPGGGIKLSPAANFLGKFPEAEIELISLHGECKEATVWFGELATPGQFRATVLPESETLAGDPLDAICEIQPPGEFIYDPNPAVVRAGLVNLLAEREQLWRLDDSEEYLSADVSLQSAFYRGFRILEELPNNDKTIRAYFRKANFGTVEIKCRHVPVQAESVRRKLALNGRDNAVLIYAKILGKTRVLVCERMPDQRSSENP